MRRFNHRGHFPVGALFGALLASCMCGVAVAQENESGEAQWIWSPDYRGQTPPAGVVFFRKVVPIGNPETALLEITADDRYELYVNGRRIGGGNSWQKLDQYDLKPYFGGGKNVVAVRAENASPGAAGLVARLIVKRAGNTEQSFSSDNSWRSSVEEQQDWELAQFNDRSWKPAQSLGELGQAAPWGDQVRSGGTTEPAGRFTLPAEFSVQRVVHPDLTGSLVAMAFNERGEIICSRERGPLQRVSDENADGLVDTVSVYCDKMENCQGILCLNGAVFAVGDGPDGTTFCKLTDADNDGVAETVKTLLKFRGGMGEHGPHAPILGPDGLIYLVIGNHSGAEVEPAASSPHYGWFEGDLVQPKYEDAGGHAVGVKAPGGVVIRTDIDGSFVETYCGGFRNAYDIVFNRQGELFTYDSDMEWDVGLPWYRPTRVNHCIPGAEFGWRSGWSKWPDYYYDSLGAVVDVGRGSPTGVECYNHYMFPVRYHNALFIADWSMGRILAVKMKPSGGTYRATSEVFLTGRPLNVTDLGVGPDGWLYFTTGGRNTEGGIYRIVWKGEVPPRPEQQGVMLAIDQPQLNAAWGRNKIAKLKLELGDQWSPELAAVADDPRQPPEARIRAMDLMQLIGPPPAPRFLIKLAQDANPEVRAKSAYLLGIHFSDETRGQLVSLLDDPDAAVRRIACESLVRSGQGAPVDKLLQLIAEPNRYVSWAARRALERMPTNDWRSRVLDSPNNRVFFQGSLALLILNADRPTCDQILERCTELLRTELSDADFLDLLRLVQVAMIKGEVTGPEVQELRALCAEEYPALEPRMNRELVRILVYTQEESFLPRAIEELQGDGPLEERIHLAGHLRFLTRGWTPEYQLALLQFYENTRDIEGGHSFKGYIDNFIRDVYAGTSDEVRQLILDRAEEMPATAMHAVADLPDVLELDQVAGLIDLDRALLNNPRSGARPLATAIIAVLGRSKHPQAMAYLRECYEQQPDRRQELAMGLAQDPGSENWPLLIRALPSLQGAAAIEVLVRLAESDVVPTEPEPIRQVILAGLRMGDDGVKQVQALLQKWSGQTPEASGDGSGGALAPWQQWFAATYPNAPPAELAKGAEGRWTMNVLLEALEGTHAQLADAKRGALVFEKSQCVKCHRFGARGEGVGPDLTNVSRRFQRKEIVESVLFPSQVISDQYSSKTLVTTDGRSFTGIIGSAGEDAVVVLQSTGDKVVINKDEIEELVPSNKSAMPEGLFNNLTLEEIADLFAYLNSPPAN
ncbi:MAG: c-type cytochrome [Pirellulales bacterium]|nr:c-type cytochrome [Pirellulales bacterium]